MNSIEQAREAREYVGRYGGRCRDCADHDGICPTNGLPCNVEDRNKAIDHVIKALNYGIQHGFLSPSTPVDGVGAEPVAWRYRIPVYERSSWEPWRLTDDERLAREYSHRDGQVEPLYAAPLANPEAEARLRERAAEGERLRFEGDLDRWMKIIGAGITGYQPEAYAVMDAACHELVALRAEARLAQAEGGPKVTEVRPLDEWHEDYGDAVWWTWQDGQWLGEPSYIGGPNDSDWPGYHTHWSPHPAFPAALHPQSAGGEEGRP